MKASGATPIKGLRHLLYLGETSGIYAIIRQSVML